MIRLYPEYAFFNQSFVQEKMTRSLFVWSKEHPQLSYRQGMHELLAPFFFVVYRDSCTAEERDKILQDKNASESAKLLAFILDEKYIEHDSYMMFSRLMERMKEYFEVQEKHTPIDRKKRELFGNAIFEEKDSHLDTSIHRICDKIQNIILKRKDVELYRLLRKMEIEPQIYALKWVRLLFGREFHIEDVLVVWDALFADCGGKPNCAYLDLSLIEYIAVAMLINIRSSRKYTKLNINIVVMNGDYSSCLKRLMKYPPVTDVHMFIKQAMEMRRNPHTPFKKPEEPKIKPLPTGHKKKQEVMFPKFFTSVHEDVAVDISFDQDVVNRAYSLTPQKPTEVKKQIQSTPQKKVSSVRSQTLRPRKKKQIKPLGQVCVNFF